ncbi:MAG: ATP-binding protein [Spirochaetes bacterium]|nr:ATP-binding protein [Spirochaetota bacterium]
MTVDRYLTRSIYNDLNQKMVFVGGPRQVGKTTLAKKLIGKMYDCAAYFNWDNRQDRKIIIHSQWPGNANLIILDEIHKYKNWKSFVKGEYDKHNERFHFLVTGSARLDVYRRGGDSLQGRYHYYRLYPFSLAELIGKNNLPEVFNELKIENIHHEDVLLQLDTYGGFPEPCISQNSKTLRRWHNEKIERMFREDILDIERITDMSNMKLFSDMLPERVGSPLSLNSLREDIGVSHKAVSNWLNILESFYYCFRVYPYAQSKIRSIKKEPKLYLIDWSEVEDEAARFENMVATHLLKFAHFIYDSEGYVCELWYLRNVDKKEVDFLLTVNRKPWIAVETKLSDVLVSGNLEYFKERVPIPFCYQVVKKPGIDFFTPSNIRIISADKFLAALV